MIKMGQALARSGLVVARAGNLSCRLDPRRMLVTASGSALGTLRLREIVAVDIATGAVCRGAGCRNRVALRPSSESPMHRLIHRTFAGTAVVHCHPTLINAYFCIYPGLKYLTFESRYYLGEVPVVGQKTLTVTDPGPVIEALRRNSIVVLRNHGVVSRAPDFSSAMEKIAILEEAVRVYAIARLFNRKKLDALDRELERYLAAAV